MYGYVNQGWQCPVCKRIYSPGTTQCLYCNDSRVIWATNTNTDDWKESDFLKKYTEDRKEWLNQLTTQSTTI